MIIGHWQTVSMNFHHVMPHFHPQLPSILERQQATFIAHQLLDEGPHLFFHLSEMDGPSLGNSTEKHTDQCIM